MFKDKTSNKIHEEMMKDISNEYDKTEGSFIFDATKPPAIKLEEAYKDLDSIINKFNLENLAGDELEKRIHQTTGISRKPATKSIGQVELKGNGTVSEGDLFETESGIQFQATETKVITAAGLVKLQCTKAGSIGNVPANQIKLIPITIGGITDANNPEPTTGGFEAETDKALLQRYYERIKTPATSGNKAQYKNWAKEVQGVGDAKVFPLWNGDNTVKIVIIDSLKEPAGQEIVDRVQEYVDPGLSGIGEGTAPIGAFCTVVSAAAKPINVVFAANIDSGYTNEEILNNVKTSISKYLKDITFTESYVSYAIIGSLVLQAHGIQDYSNLTINGGTSNITIEEDEVAVLGEVVING
ncbi:baseplate J/gp47 family protein [Alkaliphilus peptidifermentans]|uniref:Uncharacterized phage protein gp47/JayE n=1 Tax=Alkaliphilus peptidifermentans DSM 18978 TaxID=1120976 RepID=A0A1G5JZA8_9FIRM|nr:baseplate J/gp47 family protein [Alkaliphilus peptidifermentans]SCY92939.1 Uncharacterized phage protein gp47/JayE [Alkaliphilus peptidifermentans DSM 18978]